MALFLLNACNESEEISPIEKSEDFKSVVKLINVETLDNSLFNKRTLEINEESDIRRIHVDVDGEEYKANIIVSPMKNNEQRVTILGPNDDKIYLYFDLISEGNNRYIGKYYTADGELLLENVFENDIVKVTNVYRTAGQGSENLRMSGFWDDFSTCVDNFVGEVGQSAEWSAVMTVGMLCCAPEVAAGLAVGCAIYAW